MVGEVWMSGLRLGRKGRGEREEESTVGSTEED